MSNKLKKPKQRKATKTNTRQRNSTLVKRLVLTKGTRKQNNDCKKGLHRYKKILNRTTKSFEITELRCKYCGKIYLTPTNN